MTSQATVLSKATEYITYLEQRTKYLTKESQVLKASIKAFEILVIAQSSPKFARRAVAAVPKGNQRHYALDGPLGVGLISPLCAENIRIK